MTTRYFVNESGAYIGGFDGAEPPAGAIEVASPPNHGLDIWNGVSWIPYEPTDQTPTEAIIKSPDGTTYRITVENDGTLATEALT